jgi:WD40 repeat protein
VKLGPSYFVRFSPDGAWLASCGTRSVHIRRPTVSKPTLSAKLLHSSDGDFSPDSHSLLLKTTSGALHVLGPLDARPELRCIDAGRGEGAPPRYSACGRYIVDGSWDGHLVVLDSTTGAYVARCDFPSDMIVQIEYTVTGDRWFVRHSPRATTHTEPPDPNYFTVWSLPLPSHPHRVIRPNLRFVRDSALSPAGEMLALVHGAPPVNLSIVDADSGETLRETQIEIGGTGGRIAWAPRGVLAVVEQDRLRFYSAELGVVGVFELAYACDVAFSPRDDLIAIGSWESGRVLSVSEVLA